jgi:quinol-cytochrome oxidoreductase complex cytochrome b subunit
MPINALWSMSSRMLCLRMFAQHVVLVGFVVIVVISLTLWMLRHRCSYTCKCLITLRSDSTI